MKIKRFRKKPIVIEAIQFDGFNYKEIKKFVGDNFRELLDYSRVETIAIITEEGLMNISLDDWVIKGVKGEFYPCKPDIFEASYEEVTE